jgi:parallel beta-helix repeat protein
VNLDVGPVDDGDLLAVDLWGHHVEVRGGNWHNAPYGTVGCGNSGTLACYAFYINGKNNLIENAKIHDNPSYGIHNFSGYSERADENVYRFNEIYNNGNNPVSSQVSAAILLGSGDKNEAYGNIVRDNYASGIATSFNATNSLIYNNTVYNNGSGGISWGSGSGTIIKNNIVYNNSGADLLDTDGVQTPIFANNHCTATGPGCAQSGDPLFADVANHNFTLLAGSPAKGAGTPDISGDVSFSFVPDIGAVLDLQP